MRNDESSEHFVEFGKMGSEESSYGGRIKENKKMNDLTIKQETFCLKYIETGNASEAYRQAYDSDGMKPESVNRKAIELLENGKITARIKELQDEHQARHEITVDDLIAELEEAREVAKAKENANAMISATLGKAKLLGLDKQITESQTVKEVTDFAEWLKNDV